MLEDVIKSKMSYFECYNLQEIDVKIKQKEESILQRRNRELVSGFEDVKAFRVGDILNIVFFRGSYTFRFTGLCMSVNKKALKAINTSLLLRNFMHGVGIEMTVSYYYHRMYNLTFSDFKRKDFFYRRSRLYYIRNLFNRGSKVK